MARLLLGVSGGIAAYKALEIVRLATGAGHRVRVVCTPAARRFVGPASFAALTGAPVLWRDRDRDPLRGAFPGDPTPAHDPLSHLELVANADCLLIAPASANTIAKLAHGLADNLLCEAALVARCPVIVAPAMNDAMYEHPATRANIATLSDRGVEVLEPGTGRLGSPGEWGVGRLREPPELLAAVERVLDATNAPAGSGRSDGGPPATDSVPGAGGRTRPSAPLAGLRVLVSAGGTREPIDAVRYIANRSSGRMGFALADEARRRGAAVEVVAANVALPRTPGIDYADVQTAAELAAACRERFAAADVLLMAAAVVDFRPAAPAAGKLKKADDDALELRLERTEDILASLALTRRAQQTLVGFAAEHGVRALEYGREKLGRKGVDLVVVNDISGTGIGFDASDNEVWIVRGEGERHVPRTGKDRVAAAVLDEVAALRASLLGAVAGAVAGGSR